MTDQPRDTISRRDTQDGNEAGLGRGSPTGTPRWVKVFGIIAIVVVLLVAVLLIFGGGGHGPGRHIRSDSGIRSEAPTIEVAGGQASSGTGHSSP